MDITFRKTGSDRYAIDITRAGFPDVTMDPAPGFDPDLPHDLVHLIVELETELGLGVFGQLAKGGDSGTFRRHADAPQDARAARRQRRRSEKRGEKLSKAGHRDSVFSERAAVICEYEWKRRSGDPRHRRRAAEIAPYAKRLLDECSPAETARLSPGVVDSVCERFDALSRRWRGLEVGEGLTFHWPE